MGNCLQQVIHSFRNSNAGDLMSPMIEGNLTSCKNTPNDPYFVYFVHFWQAEQLLNMVMLNKSSLRYNYQRLTTQLKLLQQYLQDMDRTGSQLNQKLIKLRREVSPTNGMLTIQIQSIKMFEKCKQLRISVTTSFGSQLKSYIHKCKKHTHIFQLNLCSQHFTPIEGYITFNINGATLTLSLRDIQKSMVLLIDILNLRCQNSFDSTGQISLRIECIRDVSVWEKNTKVLFGCRQKQILKIFKEYQEKIQTESQNTQNQRIYIKSSLSEIPKSLRISQFDNQFLID